MAGGVIGVGRRRATEAISGMSEGAKLETARETALKQIEAAEEEKRKSMIGTGMGLGAAFGPSIVPAVAGELGVQSAITGTTAATAGLPSAAVGSAGSVGLMEAGASGALAGAGPGIVAALGPVGIGAGVGMGLAYLLSEFL